MVNFHSILLLVFAALAVTPCASQCKWVSPPKEIAQNREMEWVIDFKDDFKGPNKWKWDILDKKEWNAKNPKLGQSKNHFYRASQVKFERNFNGVADAVVFRNRSIGAKNTAGRKYEGGALYSRKKFSYGFFTACVKTQYRDNSVWPAFWLVKHISDRSYLREIDIMEWNHFLYESKTKTGLPANFGPGQNIHYQNKPCKHCKVSWKTRSERWRTAQWRNYSVLFLDNQIRFYVDGKEVRNIPKDYVREFNKSPFKGGDQLQLRLTSSPSQYRAGDHPWYPWFAADYVYVWKLQ